ncbi:MAG: hypothetical protein K9M02_01100 [Thiohalocapsa sp.]|nr:hypothetical protein [Thiohalocapsa sp.]
MSKITLSEFQEMLADIDVPDSEIAGYLTADPQRSKPFLPAFGPDPEKVAIASDMEQLQVEAMAVSGMLNSFGRLRRRRRFKKRVGKEDLPIVYAEGDSWFQFPFMIEDVIDHLDSSHLVWCSSAAGDTLKNMVFDDPEYPKQLRKLKQDGHSVSAFLFSGAGNDVVGQDADGVAALSRIVRDYNPNRSIQWHIETDALVDTMAFIEKAYRKVLDDVDEEFPGIKVVLHGYDRAPTRGVPNGDPNPPVWAKPWTSDPLTKRGFPDNDIASDVVAAILDRVNELTKGICNAYPHAVYADLRNTVPAGEWADELHPTDNGFAEAAAKLKTFL